MTYKINVINGVLSIDRISIMGAKKSAYFLALIGLIIAIIGFAVFKWGNQNDDTTVEFSLIAILVGSGLALFGGINGLFFVGRAVSKYPERVLFNNQEARVEIIHHSSFAKKAYIPYKDISRIETRSFQYAPSSNKSLFEDRNYSVVMRLKDGSAWELTDAYKSSSYAEQDLEKILQHVALQNESNNAIPLPKIQSAQLSLLHHGDELRIQWKNYAPARHVRGAIITLVLMALACFSANITVLIGSEEEGRTWEVIFRSLIVEMNNLTLNRLFEILGVPLTVIMAFLSVLIIVLIYRISKIMFYRIKNNSINFSNTFFSTSAPQLNIPAKSIGNVHFSYYFQNSYSLHNTDRELFITKEKLEPKPVDNSIADFAQVDDFTSFTKASFKFFKASLKDFASGAYEAEARRIENNTLVSFNFQKFSPVDLLAIYGNIKHKIEKAN